MSDLIYIIKSHYEYNWDDIQFVTTNKEKVKKEFNEILNNKVGYCCDMILEYYEETKNWNWIEIITKYSDWSIEIHNEKMYNLIFK